MKLSNLARPSLFVALAAVGCGGGGEVTGPPSGDTTPATVTVSAGGGQTARVGAQVATVPAVLVRNAAGEAVADVSVTFTVEAGSGAIVGGATVTDANGIARPTSWTMGSDAGENRLRATLHANNALFTTFTATARWPYWTVMVYMAADNNLAVDGMRDIDEMEAAGQDPEVSVVVQAEFSPTQFGLLGCGAACFNRPNFNTFRHVLSGSGPTANGPNGTTTDLGNRDMTDPAQLSEFVSWAKVTRPAEHYILVLWNHGGGYVGLLQDETSAGSRMMSMSELTSALQSVGGLDIVDFDMCLMGGYETLHSLSGLADYAVFSQENVPGKGNPYDQWLNAIQDDPDGSPAAVATALVDAFHDSYQGYPAPTTRSAYSIAQYASFEVAFDALATDLRAGLTTLRPAIVDALANAQKYAYPVLTDLVTFLDSLRVKTSSVPLHVRIDELRGQATNGGFRLRNRARNGTDMSLGGTNDVDRSTGLHVVLPRGTDNDNFASAGPGSLTAYQNLYPGRPWTLFLTDWTVGQGNLTYTDQGGSPFQGFLVWDSASVRLGVDVDLWILEPSGSLYVPWLGTVTPNGTLTSESSADSVWFEGYLSNRFLQNGRYTFYAELYADPNDHRPIYDLQYRYGLTDALTSLYEPNYPELSLLVRWADDPTPTFTEVEADAYTDLRHVAYLDIGPGPFPTLAPPPADEGPALVTGAPTPEQLRRIQLERQKMTVVRSSIVGAGRSGALRAIVR